jgi:hypothetical protein
MGFGNWWRRARQRDSSASPPSEIAYDLDALSEDWTPVVPDERAALIRELRRELPSGHELHGLRYQPLVRRLSRDDTIWWLPHREQWALVHLTFQAETDPRWPMASTYSTWDELLAALTD